jgi:hypothetical protein
MTYAAIKNCTQSYFVSFWLLWIWFCPCLVKLRNFWEFFDIPVLLLRACQVCWTHKAAHGEAFVSIFSTIFSNGLERPDGEHKMLGRYFSWHYKLCVKNNDKILAEYKVINYVMRSWNYHRCDLSRVWLKPFMRLPGPQLSSIKY